MKTTFPPKRIVAAVDMSKPSLAALDAAIGLAKGFGARLEVVYVQDLPLSLLGFGPETEGGISELAAQMDDFLHWREERLRARAGEMPAARLRVRTLRGSPALVLAQLARPAAADLVVLGTHGHSGLERAAFGSVAEAVVRRAQVPVLTLRDPLSRAKGPRVLAPFNLRDYAEPALEVAARWAQRLRGSLTVLNVAAEEWPKAARQRVRARLEPLLGSAALHLLQTDGDPRAEIVREASSGRYELVVLAAHRKPFGGGMILGSTAERVLRHSAAPVLSVPSAETAAETKSLARAIAGKIYGW